jgi:outer membrane lipoprotein-sorting protein
VSVAKSLLILGIAACTQLRQVQAQTATSSAQPATPAKAGSNTNDDLARVLGVMDKTAANFRAAQANFVWRVYNAVASDFVGPDDTGTIYFRRSGDNIQMAADLKPPDEKQIVFTGEKIQIYQPNLKQVDIWGTSAHKDEFEAFLVLGFGSSGEEMRKSFNVRYAGQESIDGVNTAKLELTPLSENVSRQFPKIDLWIDLRNGISVQQQLFQTGGDYRLAKYSKIQLKPSLPNKVFELKKQGDTKVVTH